jgi:single-strand DNA-binding protein
MNVNQVNVCGRITRDPDSRLMPSGKPKCAFTIATNRRYTDSEGDRQEQTEFHSAIAWGKQAEIISQYAKKGTLMWVTGRLQTRSWDDKAHPEFKHYRTEIVVEDFELGPKGTSAGEKEMAVTLPSEV